MDVRVSRSRGGRGLCRITSRIVGDQDGRPLPAAVLGFPFFGGWSEHFPSVGHRSVLHICGRILVRVLMDSVSVAGNNSLGIGEAAPSLRTLNGWRENAVLQALGLPSAPLPPPHAGGLKNSLLTFPFYIF